MHLVLTTHVEADMKKYIGIDLHSNNSVVLVSDDEDRVIFQKRMANDLKLIEDQRSSQVDKGVLYFPGCR
jgi:hypothetical protein